MPYRPTVVCARAGASASVSASRMVSFIGVICKRRDAPCVCPRLPGSIIFSRANRLDYHGESAFTMLKRRQQKMTEQAHEQSVAIVTGAGRGLGRSMVLGLARAGVHVIATAARERNE